MGRRLNEGQRKERCAGGGMHLGSGLPGFWPWEGRLSEEDTYPPDFFSTKKYHRWAGTASLLARRKGKRGRSW